MQLNGAREVFRTTNGWKSLRAVPSGGCDVPQISVLWGLQQRSRHQVHPEIHFSGTAEGYEVIPELMCFSD